LKIGCCGFSKGMKTYLTRFNVVEVQTTFYQLPTIKTVEKWYSLAPQDFEFCVKAWQGITHQATSPTYKRFRGSLEKPENYGFFQQTDEVIRAWKETKKIALHYMQNMCYSNVQRVSNQPMKTWLTLSGFSKK